MAVTYTINGMSITVNGATFTLTADTIQDKRYVFYDDGTGTINFVEVVPNGAEYSLPSGAAELLHVVVPCNCVDLVNVDGWGIIDVSGG